MQSFSIAMMAVFPFLFYMGLGAGARCAGMVTETLLNQLTAMVFRCFFPFLMFKNMYWAERAEKDNVGFTLYAVVSVLILIGLCMVFVPRFEKENSRRGVLVQAIYRSNLTLFTIPLAESLYGNASGYLVALLIAFITPVYNIAAILVLEYFRNGTADPKVLLRRIFANPLLQGIAVGLLLRLLRVPVPAYLEKPIQAIAAMTTPLALFALGGTLHLSSVRKNRNTLIPVFCLRMVLIPFVSSCITLLLPFTAMERFLLLLLFATPIATSSYPMARSMGGDGELAGELVILTNMGSILTLFLFVFALSWLGLL